MTSFLVVEGIINTLTGKEKTRVVLESDNESFCHRRVLALKSMQSDEYPDTYRWNYWVTSRGGP